MGKKNFLDQRGAGILLPISSLPSKYGIGTLGKEAFLFVDKLKEAGQKYWQVLPVGPTSFGDSPYQSFSAFAGNPYLIDLEILMDEKLLRKSEVESVFWGDSLDDVDYAALFQGRFQILKKAYKRSKYREYKKEEEYKNFLRQSIYWLPDYCLYMALKFHFENKEWLQWDKDIRYRKKAAVEKYQKKLEEEIGFWEFCQFKFYQQWNRLKKYANKQKVRLIGDIPLYVSMDSADVWAHSDLFQLDERKRPTRIAGVPPDYFSETGQRWGNPLYDWDKMEEESFRWWARRMAANAKLYDVIRIDHFIGIVNYWSIPSTCPTAVEGKWCEGPGKKLTDVIEKATKGTDIIAEDLGVVAPNVRELIEKTEWPGMKILQFAFDGDAGNEYLPHNYPDPNCLVYGGTHDNETLMGFFGEKKKKDLKHVFQYLNISKKKQIPKAMLRAAYGSIAATAIFQMQDILGLDNSARMNLPSTVGINWRWRMVPGQFGEEQVRMLKKLCKLYGR